MKHGLYVLSYDGTTLIGRVVIQDATIFNTELIDWLTGNVSPSGLVEGLIKGGAEYAVNEAATNLPVGCASANMMSMLEPYTAPIITGTVLSKWQMLTGGGVYEEVTVTEDLYFDYALGYPMRHTQLESSGLELSLLEVKTIDVQFRTQDELEPEFYLPLGYMVQPYVGDPDFSILSPPGSNYQAYQTEMVVSSYSFPNPALSTATLVLQYSAPFFESPLPAWHFLYQTGKQYTMNWSYDDRQGYQAAISNWYNVTESPADAVPFFSADYPVNYSPYLRIFGSQVNTMRWTYDQESPEILSALTPSLPVYVVETDRLVYPPAVNSKSSVLPAVVGALVLSYLRKRRG